MLRHQGGDHVAAGFYLNLDSWEISAISGRDGGVLANESAAGYVRIPILAMLLFAPFMGAVFAIFLPFIGIYIVGQDLLGRGWVGLRHATRSLVLALGPSWQPAAAHLAGHDEPSKPSTDAASVEAGTTLDALEREIGRTDHQAR